MCEDLQGQRSSFVSFCNCFFDISEVTGYAGDTEYAGLLVENLVCLTLRQVLFFSSASLDRGYGCTVAEVAGDDLQVVQIDVQHLRSLFCNILV